MNKSTLFTLAGVTGISILVYNLAASGQCLNEISNPRILLLGDSLTGTAGYCSTIQKVTTGQVLCRSYSGKGIDYIHKAGLVDVQKHRPDLVVLLAGVNDLASDKSVEYVTTHLDQFYRESTQSGIKVAAITLTPWSRHAKGQYLQAETKRVNSFITRHPALCAVIDSASLKGQAADGLHLTAQGGKNLAKIVIKTAMGVL